MRTKTVVLFSEIVEIDPEGKRCEPREEGEITSEEETEAQKESTLPDNGLMERAFANLPAFSCSGVAMLERRVIWERWKRAFLISCDASTAVVKDSATKRSLLLAHGGMELQDIYYNIPGTDVESPDDTDPLKLALKRLDEYFAPQRHDTHERFLFHKMTPEPQEPLEKFLMRTQVQARKCNFGKDATESQNIAVIDKVLQLAPKELREKLLQEAELTLENLIKKVNAFQAARNASEQMMPSHVSGGEKVNKVTISRDNCSSCGFFHPASGKCPAAGKTCNRCGKRNHFKSVCKSTGQGSSSGNWQIRTNSPQVNKRPAPLSYNEPRFPKRGRIHALQDETEEEAEYIDMILSPEDTDEYVWAEVAGVKIRMQIDSGAQSNIIDDNTWNMMNKSGADGVVLRKSDKKFKAYAQIDNLITEGMFDSSIEIQDEETTLSTQARFYVVRGGPQPLLGRVTARKLDVLCLGLPSKRKTTARINKICHARDFPKLKGVKVKIPVDKSIQPVIQKLRRLPLAVLGKVEERLRELLESGIIEKVDKPTEWISPMVIVIKDSGDIRLCLDMRQVNKAIKRETYPLPTLEEMRVKLSGARFFSRLDVKDAFHQIELAEESRHLTTFVTHKGLFRFTRLLFGISCAPELFQKIFEGILSICHNVVVYIDDIVVYGRTLQEHDAALERVLRVLKEYGVLLNASKCVYRMQEIEFLGHRL